MFTAALTAGTISNLIIASAIAYLALAAVTAAYGAHCDYPWFPLFLVALFLGFPIVLLAVAIGSRHRPQNPTYAAFQAREHEAERQRLLVAQRRVS